MNHKNNIVNFEKEMKAAQQSIEYKLKTYFPGEGLEKAMRYSLLAGGKRIRPVLCLKFCQAAGGTPEALSRAMGFGCGIEMLHTYSLIHDDLPCMDNDDLRRGKPTCHKVYGECVATLAGDALQAAAFQAVLSAADPAISGKAALVLAEASGAEGMCGGQYEDTVGSLSNNDNDNSNGNGNTPSERLEILQTTHRKKTGALLRAACVMGVIAAGGNENMVSAATEYAENLGMAFQIRDDMLDVCGDTETFGKPVGSDAANGKVTFVTLLGLDVCAEQVQIYTRRAENALYTGTWPGDTDFLVTLAEQLAKRDY